MTELPFEDGFFDGAYATESLEHAVEIDTRGERDLPRGQARRPDRRSSTRTPSSGAGWRLPNGRNGSPAKSWSGCSAGIAANVSSRFISYWEDVEPDGLFLAWLAEK